MQALALLGRVRMSVIFLRSGYGKLMAPTATLGMFTRYHLPLVGAACALAGSPMGFRCMLEHQAVQQVLRTRLFGTLGRSCSQASAQA